MDRNSLESLTSIESRLDQVFLIRREGGAVIETWSLSLTSLHVLQRVSSRSRDVRPGIGRGTVDGTTRSHTCRRYAFSVTATHLVYVLRKPGVWDRDSNVLQPGPDILQAVTSSKEITDLGPCLPDLAGFRPWFFLHLRAERSEIEFIAGLSGHPVILTGFTESFQEVSRKFPI